MKISRLVVLRNRRKITRYRLAKELGIEYNTLTRIENPDSVMIRRSDLKLLAEYYGSELTIEDLLS